MHERNIREFAKILQRCAILNNHEEFGSFRLLVLDNNIINFFLYAKD
jgi:hypothetical protein